MSDKHTEEKKSYKVSFYLKNPITCPVCGNIFKKEEMLTGRGRLITKDITDELRRRYEPSKKAGELMPLIYPVTVCPSCYYSAYHDDFPNIKDEYIEIALSQKVKRHHDITLIFPIVDFKKPRNIFTGTASYILSVSCYAFHPKESTPTFMKALSALRAAWLFSDLEQKYPGQNYEKVGIFMYKKAMGFYEQSIEYAQTGEERIDNIKHFGPDLDKSYGFEGLLYVASMLVYKYGDDPDPESRIKMLESAKRTISKIFGRGKSSKSKPSFILDRSKDLYEEITAKIEELKTG
ncbi:MAG: DUF2225 domain-containing protein [Spirochaetota bacterium]|nr:MAG: DUF2225 domain-containing protein [Spirochaetota bacterium]